MGSISFLFSHSSVGDVRYCQNLFSNYQWKNSTITYFCNYLQEGREGISTELEGALVTLVYWDVLFFHQEKSISPRQQGSLHRITESSTSSRANLVQKRRSMVRSHQKLWWMECTNCAYFEQEIDLKFSKLLQLPRILHWHNQSCTRTLRTTLSFYLPPFLF